MSESPDIPAGFEPLFRTSPYIEMIGPLFSHGSGTTLVLGLRAEHKHCNARGRVHGGICSALADVALGYGLSYSVEPPASLVTASLTLDFAGSAKAGDWLETQVDVQRLGGRLGFANCYIWVGAQRIVRASATFAVVDSQPR